MATSTCRWVPTLYNPNNRSQTDFLILAGVEPRTLFIFNDNEEQFPNGVKLGGGNACVRPLRRMNPPRAAGIPTGCRGRGYTSLTPHVKALIDKSFAIIDKLVATRQYDRVRYSCTKTDKFSIGTSIFRVNPDVIKYIAKQLRQRVTLIAP